MDLRNGTRRPHEFINIPLSKGCVLRLTVEEYIRGLKRGKRVIRSRGFREEHEKGVLPSEK